MSPGEKSPRELIREFFQYYPDYALCRAMAANVKSEITSYRTAVESLARKANAEEQNREQIEEKLAQRAVSIDGCRVRIRDFSLQQIVHQPDDVLREILIFYFKHPYAHGRTRKSRFLPRILRTFFLSTLVGHARRRGIDLDYDEYFDMLTLL